MGADEARACPPLKFGERIFLPSVSPECQVWPTCQVFCGIISFLKKIFWRGTDVTMQIETCCVLSFAYTNWGCRGLFSKNNFDKKLPAYFDSLEGKL